MNPQFTEYHNSELAKLERYYKVVESYVPNGKYETIEKVAQRIYLYELDDTINRKKMRIGYANKTQNNTMLSIMMDQVFTSGVDLVDCRGEDFNFKLSDDIIITFEEQLVIIHKIMDQTLILYNAPHLDLLIRKIMTVKFYVKHIYS